MAILFISALIAVAVGLSIVAVSETLIFPMVMSDYLYAAGRFLALFAYFVLAMQYVWTAKVKIIERLVTYDRRVAIHRTLGFLAIMTVTLHPILTLGVYASWGLPFDLNLGVALGFLALLLLLLIAGSTFLCRIWGVRYESWKRIHWLTFAVLTLAFFHSLKIGSDIRGLYRTFWIGLWVLHLALMASKMIHKIVIWSRSYRVLHVRQEIPNVTTLHFEKPPGEYQPGQFTFLSLRTGGRWSAWHPFSLTSTDREDSLSVAIKGVGTFTQAVAHVREGDPVKLDPAYGGFTPALAPDTRYVMIAAGVGIAPIYGILKHLRVQEDPPEVVLLYTAHHESEILFRGDLDRWFAERPNWRHTYVVSSQPDWDGEKGRLTPSRALRLCNEDVCGTFFLCGPQAMVRDIRKHLRSRGVPRRRIRHEHFVFLP